MADIVKWQVFMAHIKHSETDYLKEELKGFKYLLGLETSEYEHYHFLVEMSDKAYHAFSKKIFKDKYKLRGRAIKGCPRQYGKEKSIRDIQKVARYTCKDKNVVTNIPEEELEDILGQKLDECKNTKNESMDNIRKCCIFVENQIYGKKQDEDGQTLAIEDNHIIQEVVLDKEPSERNIKIQIILWMKREKMNIRKSTIETYYLYIISQSEHFEKKSYEIYDYLYNE